MRWIDISKIDTAQCLLLLRLILETFFRSILSHSTVLDMVFHIKTFSTIAFACESGVFFVFSCVFGRFRSCFRALILMKIRAFFFVKIALRRAAQS